MLLFVPRADRAVPGALQSHVCASDERMSADGHHRALETSP